MSAQPKSISAARGLLAVKGGHCCAGGLGLDTSPFACQHSHMSSPCDGFCSGVPQVPMSTISWKPVGRRGDLVRRATRRLPAPASWLMSRRSRVLGTKLQERPRAGLCFPLSLSRVTWLVTCGRKKQRLVDLGMLGQRTAAPAASFQCPFV